jgi:hypothetical protein
MTARPRRRGRLAAGLAVVLLVWLAGFAGLSSPASAHPLGAPQSVRIGAEDRQVWVRWTASPDDLTALGIHLGVLGDDRSLVYDQGVLVPEQYDDYDAVRLANSPAFAAYLLEHIAVDQRGRPCPGRVTNPEDVLGDGARVEFTCAEPVDEVTVRVDTLTDIDPAYRTLASSESGERATYTKSAPEQRWELSREAGLGGYPMGFWVTALVLVVVVVPGISFLIIRQIRAAQPAASP